MKKDAGQNDLTQQQISDLIKELENRQSDDAETDTAIRGRGINVNGQQDQIKKSIASLQESLDSLRLGIKYLLFDLEATRRENCMLRKLLEHNNDAE